MGTLKEKITSENKQSIVVWERSIELIMFYIEHIQSVSVWVWNIKKQKLG